MKYISQFVKLILFDSFEIMNETIKNRQLWGMCCLPGTQCYTNVGLLHAAFRHSWSCWSILFRQFRNRRFSCDEQG